jgi:hypothetical protein
MEFFLYNVLNAIRLDVFAPNDPLPRRCLLMDDFMQFIEEMPSSLLPDYRRKRQYVNSILSKHEVNRDDLYNRKLFVRRSRGCYDVLPGAEVSWGQESYQPTAPTSHPPAASKVRPAFVPQFGSSRPP